MANETTIDSLFASGVIENLKTVDSKLKAILKSYTALLEKIGEGISFNPSDLAGLTKKTEEYEKNMKSLQATTSEYNRLAKEHQSLITKIANMQRELTETQQENNSSVIEAAKANKLNKEAVLAETKAETERIRQLKIINGENRTYKATQEELTKILNTQVKSIKEAEEQNKKLRYAVKNVSDEDANAVQIRAQYNKKIDENTRYIKQNTDAHSRQKMTIGDYKTQIVEALRAQGSFNDRIKNTISIIQKQKGAIALAAGAFAAYKVASFAIDQGRRFIVDTINTIKEFEKANSILASILGTTSKDIRMLTEDAKRLGATTAATASQVTQLQTELAKLGFSREEILASTEAVLQFALATGSDLPDAAALAGAALRIFDADARDMDRYVSAMAVSTNKSALSFSKLATAIPIVAPVAKAFGFEIEDVLTLLAKLSDAGFDASMAATATRNIFLNLADSSGKLATALGRPVTNMQELQDGLISLKERGIDLNEMLDLTDKRSVAAFARFVDGAADLTKFKDAITDVNDEMKKSAEERVNNLSGSLTKLSSAWRGLMLTFSNSTGILKSTVDWLIKVVDLTHELISTDEENEARFVMQAQRRAVSEAKQRKDEVEYLERISFYKKQLTMNGIEDSEAESKAIEAVRKDLQKKYEEQVALAKNYQERKKELEESETKASLSTFASIGGLASIPGGKVVDIALNKTREIKDVSQAFYDATAEAEKFKYILAEIDKDEKERNKTEATPKPYKTKEQLEKEQREAERAAKERLKIQQNLEQATIDLMNDGDKKERAQLIFNFQKKIDAIRGNSDKEKELREKLSLEMSQAIQKFDADTLEKNAKEEIELRLKSVKQGSEEEHELRLQLLELNRQAELKKIRENGNTEEENQSILFAINEMYNHMVEDENTRHSRELIKISKRAYDQRLLDAGLAMKDELIKASNEYNKGVLTKEQYERKKLEIQRKYAIESQKIIVESAEDAVKLLPKESEARLDAEQALTKARIALSNMEKDIIIKNNEDIQDSFQQWMDEHQKQINNAFASAEALGDLFSSIGGMYDVQIQKIEEEQDANEAATDEEIERIERLAETDVITTEEAEARKRAAEERTAQKNKELDKQKADLQTRQARFDKAAAITQTIINTAQAVMKAMTAGFPLGPILAAIVTATGAIQLATIMAQPIPKYAKGTPEEGHPGGLAIVGDGGKSEAIVIGDKIYRTPSVPTLVDLPKGADVLSDVQQADFLAVVQRETGYFLTHNQHGEPVSIVNNFDTSGIEYRLDKLMKVQKDVIEAISDGRRRDNYEAYKNWR